MVVFCCDVQGFVIYIGEVECVIDLNVIICIELNVLAFYCLL